MQFVSFCPSGLWLRILSAVEPPPCLCCVNTPVIILSYGQLRVCVAGLGAQPVVRDAWAPVHTASLPAWHVPAESEVSVASLPCQHLVLSGLVIRAVLTGMSPR